MNCRLGRHWIRERLGRGGVGVVYRAEHSGLSKQHAIKVLLGQHAANRKSVERFRREARALARLAHPNIVQVVDFGSDTADVEGSPLDYLVMEWLQGPTLSELLEHGPLSVELAIGIAIDICTGLAHAHSQGFVHRDLKPANIAPRTPDRSLKILDFGLVASLEPDSGSDLTTDFVVLGTPAYMAPEQALCSGVNERADLYALGCILFHMVEGRPPFEGPRQEVLWSHGHRPPPHTQVSESLDEIIQLLLAKDPALRPGEAHLIAEELAALLGTEKAALPRTVSDSAPSPQSASQEQLPPEDGHTPDLTFDSPRTTPRRTATQLRAALGVTLLVVGMAGTLRFSDDPPPPVLDPTTGTAVESSPPGSSQGSGLIEPPISAAAPPARQFPSVVEKEVPRHSKQTDSPKVRFRHSDATSPRDAARLHDRSGVEEPAAPKTREPVPEDPTPEISDEPLPSSAEPVATEPAERPIVPATGFVNIVVSRGQTLIPASISIDGRVIERGAPLKVELTQGPHVLVLSPANGVPLRRIIRVQGGNTVELAWDVDQHGD